MGTQSVVEPRGGTLPATKDNEAQARARTRMETCREGDQPLTED